MLAAIAAGENGEEVLLLEKNEKTGKKIFITGKGRCNVTNACDRDDFFAHIISNPKFLYSAYSSFDNQDLMRLIEDNHTPLKVERGNRVFPASDHSYDIIDALKKAMKNAGVKVLLNTEAEKILCEENKVTGVRTKAGEVISADRVILATGGLSYPSTGSTGDGHRFAKELGHSVTDLMPALVPLETKEEWATKLQGLSLKNVKLTLYIDNKKTYSEQGEMLFTHFGISGPLVLSASSVYSKEIANRKQKNGSGEAYVLIDLKPALSEEETDRRLLKELEAGNRKELKNILKELYPLKLAGLVCEITGLDPYKKCNEVTREERKKLLDFTKGLKLTITGTRGFQEAVITHGGVSCREVNPKTMESKLVSGLYFAGEMLDVDAFTGGFNLQIAFSTGYLAGISGHKNE